MLRKLKLRNRIAIVFIVGGIIPMFLIDMITSHIYRKNLQITTSEVSQQLSAQIESNIDTYLDNISQISLYPYYDRWMQEHMRGITLEGEKDYVYDREKNEEVSNFLFNMMIQNKYIRSIFLTDLNGRVIYEKSNGGVVQGQSDFFESYIQEMESDYILIATHRQDYLKRSNLEVFSYVRILKDVYNNTPIGYVILEIKVDAISKLIQNLENSREAYIAIYLEDGSLLETNFSEEETGDVFVNQYQQQIKEGGEIAPEITAGGKKYLVSYSDSSDYGLTTLIYRDEDKIFQNLNRISGMASLFTFSILLFVLAYTFISAYRLTVPLNSLANAMEAVERGNFKVSVEKRNEDEVGKLTDTFNTMVKEIDDLITREYRMELREKETEIKALQNQINPHFLYNTLESIAMMAEINDDSEVAEMVSDLGAFFRFVKSGTDNRVKISSELEYVATYVRILNVRFDDRINVDISCPKELGKVEIIKLCIQPLVENSVMHGYKQSDRMEIFITVERKGNNLLAGVRDCGVGMKESELVYLRESMEEPEERGGSIGLKNVHQRLVLTYGGESGLHVESREGKGTYVWFVLPDIFDEGKDTV